MSNYEIHHLEELAVTGLVRPQVNQILYNPLVCDRQFDLVSVTSHYVVMSLIICGLKGELL